MPITRIDEAHHLGDGEAQSAGGRFTRTYNVWFLSDIPDEIDSAGVLFDPQISGLASKSTPHGTALCTGKRATFRDRLASDPTTQVWLVALDYQVSDVRLDVALGIDGGAQRFEDYQLKDLDGKIYANACGDLLQPLPAVEFANQRFVVRFNWKKFNFLDCGIKLYFVNESAWLGHRPRSVKFVDQQFGLRPLVTPLPNWAWPQRDYWYWEVAYHFEIHANVWNPTEFPHVGYRCYEKDTDQAAGIAPKLVKDGDKVSYSGQVFLDEHGMRVAPWAGDWNNIHKLPTIKRRQLYECDFNSVFPFITYLGD